MASVESISIGANRQTHVSDVHPVTHHIAYGASTSVALWDPLDPTHRGVYQTLNAHTEPVTCVRFLPGTLLLVSGGEDGVLNVWKNEGGFGLAQTLSGHHQGSITSMGVSTCLLVTGDSFGQVALWGVQNDQLALLHSFTGAPGFFPLSMALQRLEDSTYVLAVGGTHADINVYSFGYHTTIEAYALCAKLPGHEDWIKALAFKEESPGVWMLASGSQDRYIRLWRLCINERIDTSDEDPLKLILLANKSHRFSVGTTQAAFSFDSLIMGHDDWITSLNWHPAPGKMYLLSSCADTSLMIWAMDELLGIWCCVSRLGEISIKGASTATGAAGGFWSALWFEDDTKQWIATNGKTGSFRVFSCPKLQKTMEQWDQNELGVGGATRAVTDVAWSVSGDYLLYTSLDQTTRLMAQWTRDGCQTWHEFARPQIHGYDMMCVKPIDDLRFVSGGDEKLLRIFELPRGVAEILGSFTTVKVDQTAVSEAASLPVLGLSNKAEERDEEEETPETQTNITYVTLRALPQPPLEDHLQRHTLYPELEKLYGHGYELVTADVSHDGKTIASSCRSNSKQHSAVRLFKNTAKDDWVLSDNTLVGHDLTVTRVRFSKNDRYLLSVSRDRSFILWELVEGNYVLALHNEKAHSRIVWDCCWGPGEGAFTSLFATGSRDKSVKVWRVTDTSEVELVSTLKRDTVVTAVDMHVRVIDGKALLAVGFESGAVELYSVSAGGEITLRVLLARELLPASRVNRVAWNNDKTVRLAVGSDDSSLRIYTVEA